MSLRKNDDDDDCEDGRCSAYRMRISLKRENIHAVATGRVRCVSSDGEEWDARQFCPIPCPKNKVVPYDAMRLASVLFKYEH